MKSFEREDVVRVDIPVKSDPDYEKFHGRTGTIIDVMSDETGRGTGDERDLDLFTVEFEDGTSHDFRWRDLRPVPGR